MAAIEYGHAAGMSTAAGEVNTGWESEKLVGRGKVALR